MRIRTGSRRRAMSLAAALVSLLMLVGGPVQAADPTPPHHVHTGRPGVHRLVPDSEETPAARCRYGYVVEGEGYYNGVHKIRVIAPVVFARAGKRSQRVAARLVIQYWDFEDSAWLKYGATTWQTRTATPTRKADFSPRSMIIDSRPLHNLAAAWRARLDIRWYGGDGTVKGTARLFPDWYAGSEGATQLPARQDFCGGTTG